MQVRAPNFLGRSFCVWGKKGEYERFFDADLYHRASCAFRLYRVAVKAAEKRQGCEWAGDDAAFAGAADRLPRPLYEAGGDTIICL